MKKIYIIIIFLLYYNNMIFAQIEDLDEQYVLNNIENHFIGVYLSTEFLATLEETKNYAIAMNHISDYGSDGFYETLIVYENHIVYLYPYYDGFSLVSKYKYPYYNFEYVNENEIIIADPNGHKYIRITDNLENYNDIIDNIVGNIVLHDLIVNNYILLENNIVSIPSLDNKNFIIGTLRYLYHNSYENLKLEDIENNRLVILNIENNLYTIFWVERNFYTSYNEVKRIVWEQNL